MRRITRKNVKPVHISVHPDFFDRLETERKNMEKTQKRNFTRIELTEALAKTRIDFPTIGRDVFNATKKAKQKRRRN